MKAVRWSTFDRTPQMRAGYFSHYAGEGAVKSGKFGHAGEKVDLCACRTQATYCEEDSTRILTLDTVDIEFDSLTMGGNPSFAWMKVPARSRLYAGS